MRGGIAVSRNPSGAEVRESDLGKEVAEKIDIGVSVPMVGGIMGRVAHRQVLVLMLVLEQFERMYCPTGDGEPQAHGDGE